MKFVKILILGTFVHIRTKIINKFKSERQSNIYNKIILWAIKYTIIVFYFFNY